MDSMKKMETIREEAQNNEPASGRKEILFDGYYYDVTDFMKKHPGGGIISYYTQKGEDGTLAIQQFHNRSMNRVEGIMSSLKRRPALSSEIGLPTEVLEKNRILTEDFTKLYFELKAEGLFEPSYVHIFLRTVDVLIVGLIGYYLLLYQNFFAKAIGVILLGLMQGRSGWMQHEFGHNSMTGKPKLERLLHIVFIGLGMGFSAKWWTRQHNRHHAMPQRLKFDVDLNTLPIVAYHSKVVKNPKAGKSFLIQYQAYLFPFVDTFLIDILWKLYLHPKFVLQRRDYLEMVGMLGHWVILYHIGLWPGIISSWIKATYLLLNFTLNHTYLPITTEPTHWVEYSLLHTADVEHTRWVDWWMGYLNYQIEHHLFPTMPQFRHPLITDRVRALAEKHNIPYIVHSYTGAMWNVFQNMANVSKELKYS